MSNPILKCAALVVALTVPRSFGQQQPAGNSPPAAAENNKPHRKPPPLKLSHTDFRKSAAELQKGPIIVGTITSGNPDKDVVLPPTGVLALQEANKFLYGENKPAADEDGWVTYTYGRGIPVVVASPLHLSTIRLEKGESIVAQSSDLVGDPNIKVIPRTFGSGADQQTFVLIKPTNAGESSDIVFGTSKRLYAIRVIVKPFDYTPRIAFRYPEDEQQQALSEYQAQLAAQEKAKKDEADRKTAENTLAALDTTGKPKNTRYTVKIKGKDAAYMRPTAIWDDGAQTHIDLPSNVAARNLPTPKVYGINGQDSPNIRYQGTNLIIDAICQRVELVSGHKQKLVITNRGSKKEVQNARR
jgi:type IV secretion system protein TrbG